MSLHLAVTCVAPVVLTAASDYNARRAFLALHAARQRERERRQLLAAHVQAAAPQQPQQPCAPGQCAECEACQH